MILQQIINIFITFSIYLLISISVTSVYSISKFFNLSHAALITSGAYFTFFLSKQCNLPISISIGLSVLFTVILSVFLEKCIFRILRNKQSKSFILLLTSLGIYVILQNLISLIWGDSTRSIRTGEVKVGHELWNVYITDTQIFIIIISFLLFFLTTLFYTFTKLGRQMRAVSSNEELTKIFGINSESIILWAFSIGATMAAIVGILVAFDTDMTPTMGFNLLLYGIVAMIIGGVGSLWGLVGGALLLATTQHLGAYYIDNKWMDAIAYVILILFLIWKPLGFSGQRLKKIEI
jgi:branched-chain amino acid transport system permease protein